MGIDSEVMRAVLAGETPAPEHFEEYFRAFHADQASATESMLAGFRDEAGRESYARLTEALALRSPEARILDIGCGDGPLLERIIARYPGVRVSGIDLVSSEIERARARLPHDRVDELVVGNAVKMPFAGGAFDAVVSHLVVMLVPDAAPVFGEVRRVLRKGGTFTFLVPRPGEPNDPIAELLRTLPAWIREIHPAFTPVNPGDARVWSPEALTALLNASGFSRVEVDDFTVEREVAAEELPALLRRRYYIGSLSDDDWAAVRERVFGWTRGRALRYREPLRLVHAH